MAAFLSEFVSSRYNLIGSLGFNCAASNLRLYASSEHGRRTGGMNRRAIGVVVNGTEYTSIRRAALALHVSFQTLLDHMAGKRTVLRGVEVRALDGDGP